MGKAKKTEGNTIPLLIILGGALFSGLGLAQAAAPAEAPTVTQTHSAVTVHDSSYSSSGQGGVLGR
jgi:hypothetical protein